MWRQMKTTDFQRITHSKLLKRRPVNNKCQFFCWVQPLSLNQTPGARKRSYITGQVSSEGRAFTSCSWLTLTSTAVNKVCSHISTACFIFITFLIKHKQHFYSQQYVLENVTFPSVDHCTRGRRSNGRK